MKMASGAKRFEDVIAWQKSRVFAVEIYRVAHEGRFSRDFVLRDQICRAAISVMSNIAEGFGRGSKLEFINSLTIAKGEAEELKSQLYRGLDNKYFSEGLFEELYNDSEFLIKKIGAFISYLNKSNIRGQKFKEKI